MQIAHWNQNESMSKKHKKVCRILNYIEHLLVLISAVTGCDTISALASVVGFPIGIKSYTTRLENLCNNCKN